jgi:hypothetical protein
MDGPHSKRPVWALWTIALVLVGTIANYAWEQLTLPRIAPVQVALQLVDEHGAPLPQADVSVTQSIDIGTQLFSFSISTSNDGCRDCTKYKRVPVFLGKVNADGKQRVTARYANRLFVEVVTACENHDGDWNNRRSLTVAEWDDLERTRKLVVRNTTDNSSRVSCDPHAPPAFFN